MRLIILSLVLFAFWGCAPTLDDLTPSVLPPFVANLNSQEYEIVEDSDFNKGFFNFHRSLNTKTYGYLAINDPTGYAPVSVVERFEVRPGDCGQEMGWSDCKNDRERSELSEDALSYPNEEGETWWYGWHMFVPEDYPNIYPAKVALGQFHQLNGRNPAFMFQNHKGGLWLDNQLTKRYYPLISESDLRGRWHKIEVHAHWSRSRDGFFKVWVNGGQKVNIKGHTLSDKTSYFKYGIYRSFLSRSFHHPAQTVYYANVRKHRSREGLLPKEGFYPEFADPSKKYVEEKKVWSRQGR